jgi:hypothetical protein
MGHDLLQVFCKGIIVIAGCGLAGFAEPSAVICDDEATCLQKNWNLLLRRSGTPQLWTEIQRYWKAELRG